MNGAERLREIYRRLEEAECEPKWVDGGRSILATCPCCGEEGALLVTEPERSEVPS